MISISSDNLNLLLSLQEDTNHMHFQYLHVITTSYIAILPFSMKLDNYETTYQLLLLPSLTSLNLIWNFSNIYRQLNIVIIKLVIYICVMLHYIVYVVTLAPQPATPQEKLWPSNNFMLWWTEKMCWEMDPKI